MAECYIDTTFISSLLGTDVNHKNNCAEVLKALSKSKKGKFADRFAIGIIDNDKRPTTESKYYVEFAKTKRLTFCKHPEDPHYLIKVGELHKAMETFLLENAKEANIDLAELNLPSDFDGFKKITKHQITSTKDERLLKLFKHLRKANEVRMLKKVLEYLTSEQYKATEQGVKDIIKDII